MRQKLQQGDKVKFNLDKVDDFISETTNVNREIDQYQKIVLSGRDQIGTIKELGINLSTVSFDDGWELPIPTKYLVLLSNHC